MGKCHSAEGRSPLEKYNLQYFPYKMGEMVIKSAKYGIQRKNNGLKIGVMEAYHMVQVPVDIEKNIDIPIIYREISFCGCKYSNRMKLSVGNDGSVYKSIYFVGKKYKYIRTAEIVVESGGYFTYEGKQHYFGDLVIKFDDFSNIYQE